MSAAVSSGSTAHQSNQSKHCTVSSVTPATQRKQTSVLQTLLQHFDANPDAAMTTADVAMIAYGVEFDSITKSHRVATMRAMRAAGKKRPALRTEDGEGPCGQLVIFNSHNVRSYALMRIKTDWLTRYQYRRDGAWCDGPFDEAPLLAELDKRYSDCLVEGAPWWNFVQQYIAEDTGDRATWLRCEIQCRRNAIRFAKRCGMNSNEDETELAMAEAELANMAKAAA